MGLSSAEACEKVERCKTKKQYGMTKFADFFEDDDSIVNETLVRLKAEVLLEKGGYVSTKGMTEIRQHNEKLAEKVEEGKELIRVKATVMLREMWDGIQKGLMDELRQAGLLEGKVEKVVGEYLKTIKI